MQQLGNNSEEVAETFGAENVQCCSYFRKKVLNSTQDTQITKAFRCFAKLEFFFKKRRKTEFFTLNYSKMSQNSSHYHPLNQWDIRDIHCCANHLLSFMVSNFKT